MSAGAPRHSAPISAAQPRSFTVLNDVFSITLMLISSICGSTNITITMDISVPRHRLCPTPTMAHSEVIFPIR